MTEESVLIELNVELVLLEELLELIELSVDEVEEESVDVEELILLIELRLLGVEEVESVELEL